MVAFRVPLLDLSADVAVFWLLVGLVSAYSLLVGFFIATNRPPEDPLSPVLFEVSGQHCSALLILA